MKLTGKEDLRVRRTVESIRRAFEELILEKDFEKITVTELADRAMINKKTFYAYYSSMDELLSEIQDELSSEFAERTRGYTYRDIDKLTREFFLFSEEKGPYYEKITCTDNIIRSRMIRNVTNANSRGYRDIPGLTPAEINIIESFASTVTLSSYKQWIKDGKQIPVERIIQIVTDLINHGLKGIIRLR